MPAPHPPEFRRWTVDLVRFGQKLVAQIAKDLGISESCLRNWKAKDDVDAGRKEGLTGAGRTELVR
jgi:transposase-like protein